MEQEQAELEITQAVENTAQNKGKQMLPLAVAMQNLAETLPIAELRPIEAVKDNILASGKERIPTKMFKSVVINEEIVSVVGKNYHLVQHYDAFMPVLRGLETADIKNVMIKTDSHKASAHMDIILDDDIADTVRIGYRVHNSHDGKHSLTYGFTANHVMKGYAKQEVSADQPIQHAGGYRYIEIAGFRQVCSNGMTIRIPVAEAENSKSKNTWIRPVIWEIWKDEKAKEAVIEISSHYKRLVHVTGVERKVAEQEKAAELMALLKSPAQQLINRARAFQVSAKECETAIYSRFGKKKGEQILKKIERTEDKPNAWNIYNSMTAYATHEATKFSEQRLIQDRAADFLISLQIDAGTRKQRRGD